MHTVVFSVLVLIILVLFIAILFLLFENKSPQSLPLPLPPEIRIIKDSCAPCPPCQKQTKSTDFVTERDQRVLYDELYPPLNRQDADSVRSIAMKPIPTRGINDTFRLIGYLVDETDKNEVWKLFARQQYSGGRAEFYASPANRNFDMKVSLDNNVITSREKFRDLYTIPEYVTVSHPMFTRNQYKVIQLPQSDFTSQYI